MTQPEPSESHPNERRDPPGLPAGGADESYETRPDRLHRYGNLGLAAFGLLGVLGNLVFPTSLSTVHLLVMSGAVLVFAVVGWWRRNQRLVVTRDGLSLYGMSRTDVAWHQVASYRLRNTAHVWSPTDLGELLIWPFVLLFRYVLVWPLRTVVRWISSRADDRSFLDSELILLSSDNKKLATISGTDRYVGVAEALERIVAALHARPLAPFVLPRADAPPLDQISELDVEPDETKLVSLTGSAQVPTGEIPNLFLFIAAVAARGAKVTVDSNVWLPRALRSSLIG